jgi:hypothetical protein
VSPSTRTLSVRLSALGVLNEGSVGRGGVGVGVGVGLGVEGLER